MDPEGFSDVENLESAIPNPEEQVFEKETLAIFESAVDALPDRLRAVFMM